MEKVVFAFTAAKSDEEARKTIDRFIQIYADSMPHDNFTLPFVRSVSTTLVSIETDTTPARTTFAFTIPTSYGNRPDMKTVHGAAITLFFDNCTSLVMAAAKQPLLHSVTRNLNVTYMRPVFEGERCVIEAELVQVGRAIATIRGVLKREKDGVVLATCHHDKARLDIDRPFKL